MNHDINIGLIGLGDMGRVYLDAFIRYGFKYIHVCDVADAFHQLSSEFKLLNQITVHRDGHGVRYDIVL